jgi:hypothetical protein
MWKSFTDPFRPSTYIEAVSGVVVFDDYTEEIYERLALVEEKSVTAQGLVQGEDRRLPLNVRRTIRSRKSNMIQGESSAKSHGVESMKFQNWEEIETEKTISISPRNGRLCGTPSLAVKRKETKTR